MEKGTITVTGRGNVHVIPDITRLEVSIQSVFPTHEAAYMQAKENSKWMVQILEYNNKNGKLAKTIRFDITDHLVNEYDDNDNYIGQIKDGVDLNQRFKIDLGMDTILLNKIIRGIGKFIPGAQINIAYTLQDQRPVQLKILERAIIDAMEKAEIMAKAANAILDSVKEIQYGHQSTYVYSQARNIHSNKEAMVCDSNSLDIAPDDLTMSEEVEVVWYLASNQI